jgi:microcystin degradation protein MlrC
MRIATGAISHETSTFTPVPTTEESFYERFGVREASEIVDTFRDTNTPMGGFIDGAQAHGFELIPTLYAEAHPSGPAPRHVLDAIVNRMLGMIADAGPVDGVLLEMHGSMVAEGLDDADGHILLALRRQVGAAVPIVVQLDIHSNISHEMIEAADVLIGRETFPEIDMLERGRECADVLVRMLRDGLKPTMALSKIPMMWGINQVTAHPPMNEAIARLHKLELRPDVVCASIATCFPLADVPDMGASVYVVTDDDQAAAQSYADELAAWIHERREDWQGATPGTREALEQAKEHGEFPVVLADRNDNTGGGSPGDSTGMLRAFLDSKLQNACVLYIVDPESIVQCHKAGAGASLTLDIGGKSSPPQGAPVQLSVDVVSLSDGRFRYDGPMYAGLEGNMGTSAYVRHDGLHILLVTTREQPFDTAFARTLGLDPRKMRYIGVKSAAHFRAGFESWAGQIHVVSEPSVHSPEHLTFRKLGRIMYPPRLNKP